MSGWPSRRAVGLEPPCPPCVCLAVETLSLCLLFQPQASPSPTGIHTSCLWDRPGVTHKCGVFILAGPWASSPTSGKQTLPHHPFQTHPSVSSPSTAGHSPDQPRDTAGSYFETRQWANTDLKKKWCCLTLLTNTPLSRGRTKPLLCRSWGLDHGTLSDH